MALLHLSSSSTLLPSQTLFPLFPKPPSPLTKTKTRTTTIIRMGGGPRTYPGGVNKWQWKRMQAKKSKQLLKARLARERQIYEMRKRAKLQAAVSELERPWEIVRRDVAPQLFASSADEQLQVLADRFQRAGGLDLWTENDGPQLFGGSDDVGVCSSGRFFPKGVVHSVKPYGVVGDVGVAEKIGVFRDSGSKELLNEGNGNVGGGENVRVSRRRGGSRRLLNEGRSGEGNVAEGLNLENLLNEGNVRGKGNWRTRGKGKLDSGRGGCDQEKGSGSNRVFGKNREFRKGRGVRNVESLNSEFYDMSLQNDGSYGFHEHNRAE